MVEGGRGGGHKSQNFKGNYEVKLEFPERGEGSGQNDAPHGRRVLIFSG